MSVCIIPRNPSAERLGRTDQKEDICVLVLAWRAHGVCKGCNAEGGLAEVGGSICMGMGKRGKCEVGKWVAVPPASGYSETLGGKQGNLAH